MATLHFLSSTIFSCVVFMFIHSFNNLSLSFFSPFKISSLLSSKKYK